MSSIAVITVRIDEETKRMMDGIDINWSEVIRRAIRERIEEERRRNFAKDVLINEELRRAGEGGDAARGDHKDVQGGAAWKGSSLTRA
ncbi:MAG: hypothetical protein QXV45_02545 [Candidatus Bathyarchaeia archaeon]